MAERIKHYISDYISDCIAAIFSLFDYANEHLDEQEQKH